MEGFCLQIPDFAQPTASEPFSGGNIGRLGIHIDEPVTFADGDQIKFGLSVGVAAFLAPDFCPRLQQFPATAGIFNVNNFFTAADFHMGDESVGPGEEMSRGHVGIMHG